MRGVFTPVVLEPGSTSTFFFSIFAFNSGGNFNNMAEDVMLGGGGGVTYRLGSTTRVCC